MASWQVTQTLKYQEDLDPTFAGSIIASPGGENLRRCIQCGTCSSICPLSIYMDYTPRRIIAMTRAGMKDEVLGCKTIWLCASCYACTAECPKQIKITDVMYALKRRAIEEKVYPRRFPIPVLAREFFHAAVTYGRVNEGRIVTWMLLKTNPFKMLKQAALGLKLFLRGRMDTRQARIAKGHGRKGDIEKMMSVLEGH